MIRQGADTQVSYNGVTLLDYAVTNNKPRMCKVLSDNGAPLKDRTKKDLGRQLQNVTASELVHAMDKHDKDTIT